MKLRLAMAVGLAACGGGAAAPDATSCMQAATTGTLRFPSSTTYVHWQLAGSGISDLEVDLEIANDPGPTEGFYLGLVEGKIDATFFYFGLQTRMASATGMPLGKGALFSIFDVSDVQRARIGPGGFTAVGTDTGSPFTSVRLPFEWSPGSYVLRLTRDDSLGEGDWFDLRLLENASGNDVYVGGIWFPRTTPGQPAAVQPHQDSFQEVYSGNGDYAGIPAWQAAIMLRSNGVPASGATSEYPTDYPDQPIYPNADISFDAGTDRVILRSGGATQRCHAAGVLF